MQLLMPYRASLGEVQTKKKFFELRTLKFFTRLQSSLTNASVSGISSTLSLNLTLLHQVLICGTHVLPQLRHVWVIF